MDLDRKLRPAGRAFKDLCQRYGELPLLEGFPAAGMQGAADSAV